MVGLGGSRRRHGIDVLLGDGGADSLRTLLAAHHAPEAPVVDEDEDGRALEDVRRALGESALRLVATQSPDEGAVRLQLLLEGHELPSWVEPMTVGVRPLAGPLHSERQLVPGATGELADFGVLAVEGLTAYVEVTVRSSQRQLAFVRALPLEGHPTTESPGSCAASSVIATQ